MRQAGAGSERPLNHSPGLVSMCSTTLARASSSTTWGVLLKAPFIARTRLLNCGPPYSGIASVPMQASSWAFSATRAPSLPSLLPSASRIFLSLRRNDSLISVRRFSCCRLGVGLPEDELKKRIPSSGKHAPAAFFEKPATVPSWGWSQPKSCLSQPSPPSPRICRPCRPATRFSSCYRCSLYHPTHMLYVSMSIYPDNDSHI